MNIHFINEDASTISAVSFDTEWRGFIHQEIFWAEIVKGSGYTVQWTDTWDKPEHFETEIKAKKHIINNYMDHAGHSNGNKYQV